MSQSVFIPGGTNSTAFNSDDKGILNEDTICGIYQKNARMWQIIALASLSSFFISLGILIYAVNLPETVPVIVTVSESGEASYVGKVDKQYYKFSTIPEISKEYQIKRLLTRMHTWIIDRVAQQDYIGEALHLVQRGAISQLDLFFRSNNPFLNIGSITRSIDIEPLLHQSEKTYIVYFLTTEKDTRGYELRKTRWSALVNIDLFEPTEQNPLGIYITNFDIKKLEEK